MLIFTETHESIGGFIITNTQGMENGCLLEQCSLPKLGDNFLPTGERYTMWTVKHPSYSGTYFFKELWEAQLFTLGILL